MKSESTEEKLETWLGRAPGNIFLRADFNGLGSYDQIGRALRALVRKGQLLKVGYPACANDTRRRDAAASQFRFPKTLQNREAELGSPSKSATSRTSETVILLTHSQSDPLNLVLGELLLRPGRRIKTLCC